MILSLEIGYLEEESAGNLFSALLKTSKIIELFELTKKGKCFPL